MIFDVSKLKYMVYLLVEKGVTWDVTKLVEALSWEESENELATRINISFANIKVKNNKQLHKFALPGCQIIIKANWGGKWQEVARGRIMEWNPGISGNSAAEFEVTAYDSLYQLDQSQDDQFFPAGTTTKAAITTIIKEWKIPLLQYKGPNVVHGQMPMRSKTIADMLRELLDDAVKKGGPRCFLRSDKGRVSVLKKGSNRSIWHIDDRINKSSLNALGVRDSRSISGLTTRVKILGKAPEDGRAPVEAVVNGKTQFGILQQIIVREQDATLEDAKQSAAEILRDEGEPKRTISVECPDIPLLRKWDLVYISISGYLNNYFVVKSVTHKADSRTMSLEVTYDTAIIKQNKPETYTKKPK